MAASDLAQLADVKAWLAGSSGIGAADDAVLARLTTDVSGLIYAYLGRPWLIPQQVTERYDGNGKPRLYLRNYPALSIASLAIGDLSIPAAPIPGAGVAWQAGYLLNPWNGAPPGAVAALDLRGHSFCCGRQNIVVTYTAGYQVSGEAAMVPSAPGPYTVAPAQPYGPWAADAGVTYADGTALTKVASAPEQGQYTVAVTNGADANPPTWSVAYGFSAADAGAGVLIAYGFIPAAINNAAIEWVAERVRYSAHIGQSSQAVQGQMTTAYSLKGMPDFIRVSLDPYRNVVSL